ncbi:hypothetical protein Tco_1205524 [Tanacetum coccineum]
MDFKSQLETIAKNHQASIQNLKAKFDRLTEKQSATPSGSLPSNTQPNPKAGMPNYGKFLKELVSSKHNLEQISSAFLSDKSSSMIQNNVPPKLGDPRSFLIPCNFSKAFSCNALADLGASINLMSFCYLEMEEDSKVPLILRRPFLHTADAVLRIKQKQFNLGVGTERIIFNIDSTMKHSYSNDDTCFSIDVIDEILEEDFDALLDEGSKILHLIEGTILEEKLFAEFDEFW